MGLHNFIRLIFPLFLFFLFLDLEINLVSFSGEGGERIGGAAFDESGEHTKKTSQEIPLKISDIFFILLSLCFIFFLVKTKDWNVSISFWKHYLLILSFILISFFTIQFNSQLSTTQSLVGTLYLIKFFQASAIYVFTFMYFKSEGNLKSLFQILLFTTLIMATFGFINSVLWSLGFESGLSFIVSDRVQFYGVLSVLALIWFVFIFKNIPTVQLIGITKNYLLLVFLLCFFSILLCGKRTVIIGFLIPMFFLVLSSLSLKNFKKNLVYIFITVSLPTMYYIYIKTFNRIESVSLTSGLAPRYRDVINDSFLAEITVSGIDYSVSERLAKNIESIAIFQQSPLFGSGFWSAPFEHNFLPDSAPFRVLVEGGLVGFLLITAFIFSGWSIMQVRKSNNSLKNNLHSFYMAAAIFIIMAGITSETIYIPSLFGIFILTSCLSRIQRFYSIKIT